MARRRGNPQHRPQIQARTLEVKTACSLSTWQGTPGQCHWCAQPLTGRQRSWCSRACQWQFESNHVWSIARGVIRRRSRRTCAHCGHPAAPAEVNHIQPLRGTGYGLSCAHHLDNLELLCRPCHLATTRRQRAEQALASGQGDAP